MVVLALVEQLIFRIQIGLTISAEGDAGLTGLGNFFCGYIYLQSAKALMPAYTKRGRLGPFGKGL